MVEEKPPQMVKEKSLEIQVKKSESVPEDVQDIEIDLEDP